MERTDPAQGIGRIALQMAGIHYPLGWESAVHLLAEEFLESRLGHEYARAHDLQTLVGDALGMCNYLAMTRLGFQSCWLWDENAYVESDQLFCHGHFLSYDDLDIDADTSDEIASFWRVTVAFQEAQEYMRQYALGGVTRIITVCGITSNNFVVPWKFNDLMNHEAMYGITHPR